MSTKHISGKWTAGLLVLLLLAMAGCSQATPQSSGAVAVPTSPPPAALATEPAPTSAAPLLVPETGASAVPPSMEATAAPTVEPSMTGTAVGEAVATVMAAPAAAETVAPAAVATAMAAAETVSPGAVATAMAAPETVSPGPVATVVAAPSAAETVAPAAIATTAVVAASANSQIAPIISAMTNQLSATSVRATTTMTQTNGQVGTRVTEFVAPDRFHVSNGPGGEYIIIGTTTYVKQGNSPWQKSPVDMGSLVAQFRSAAAVQQLAASIISGQVQDLGIDTLNGRRMHVYQYATALTGGTKTIHGTAKIWIGVDDSLPYREDNTQDSLVGTGMTESSTVIEYNQNITIEAPPVQ